MTAAELTEAHRIAQARLGTRTISQMVTAFRTLDPTDVDNTTAAWLRLTVPLIQQQRTNSSVLAANYLRIFRALKVGHDTKFAPTLDAGLDVRAAVTSLTVTGPVSLKRAATRGLGLADAIDNAQAGSSRAAMRLALNGGRSTLLATTAADKKALGWARAASGDPCAFCAMLASRGPVYNEESVDFEAHDGCTCTAEPIYSRDQDWPAGSQQFADLWAQAKETAGGDPDLDTVTAFRHAVEGR